MGVGVLILDGAQLVALPRGYAGLPDSRNSTPPGNTCMAQLHRFADLALHKQLHVSSVSSQSVNLSPDQKNHISWMALLNPLGKCSILIGGLILLLLPKERSMLHSQMPLNMLKRDPR